MMKWGSVMDVSDVWTMYKRFGMVRTGTSWSHNIFDF